MSSNNHIKQQNKTYQQHSNNNNNSYQNINIVSKPISKQQSHKIFKEFINSETNSGYLFNSSNNSHNNIPMFQQSPINSIEKPQNSRKNSYSSKAQMPYNSALNYHPSMNEQMYMSHDQSVSQMSFYEEKYVSIIKGLMGKIDKLVIELNEVNEINSQLFEKNTEYVGKIQKLEGVIKGLERNNLNQDQEEIMVSVSQSLQHFDLINKKQIGEDMEIQKLKIQVEKLNNNLNYQEIVSKNRKIELEMTKNKEKQLQTEVKKLQDEVKQLKNKPYRKSVQTSQITLVENPKEQIQQQQQEQQQQQQQTEQQQCVEEQVETKTQLQVKQISLEVNTGKDSKDINTDNSDDIQQSGQRPTEATLTQNQIHSASVKTKQVDSSSKSNNFSVNKFFNQQHKGDSYLNFTEESEQSLQFQQQSKTPTHKNTQQPIKYLHPRQKSVSNISNNNMGSATRLPQESHRQSHRSQQMGSGFQEISLIVNDKQQESNNMILLDMLDYDTFHNFQTPSPSCTQKQKLQNYRIFGSLQKLGSDISEKTEENNEQQKEKQNRTEIKGKQPKQMDRIRLSGSKVQGMQSILNNISQCSSNNVNTMNNQSLVQQNNINKSTISTTSSRYQYNQPHTRVHMEYDAVPVQEKDEKNGNGNDYIAKNINMLKTLYIKKQEKLRNTTRKSNILF